MAHKAVQRLLRIEADADGNLPHAIHLLSVGHWHTPWHGAFEHTISDLAAMVMNFDDGIGLVENNGKREAPGNFGHDRGGKAAFWINGLFLDENGTELWGHVEWTPEGARAVKEKEYKYISPEWNPRDFPWEDPEEEGKFVENVFTGAALTNIPLFKKLTPVMASADTGDGGKSKKTQGGDMTLVLAEVRVKKLEELTDDEKAFLEEHKAELTDEERTTFELVEADDDNKDDVVQGGDDSAGQGGQPKAASTGTVQIDAQKLASLEADAKAGREASQKLLRNELTASVTSHVSRGAIKSDQLNSTVDMLMASSEDARKAQLEFMENLPSNTLLAKETGKASVEASVEVTKEEAELAEAFGNTPEQIKEYKQSQATA